MPTSSSLLTFMPRPMASLLGDAFMRAAWIRSFAAQQQAGALRPANAFTARERHQVEAHLDVFGKVGDGRNVGGGVVECRGRRAFLPSCANSSALMGAGGLAALKNSIMTVLPLTAFLQLLARFPTSTKWVPQLRTA